MLNILPERTKFIESAKQGRIYPVYVELPFAQPQEVFESIKGDYGFLLESIKGPEKIARYSFAGSEPFLIFKVKDGVVEVEIKSHGAENPHIPPLTEGDKEGFSGNPLKKIKILLTSYKIESPPNLPPFIGGAVGLLSYDFVHYLERLPKTAVDDLQVPDAHFLFFDTVLAFDQKDKKTYIISCPGAEETVQKFSPRRVACGDKSSRHSPHTGGFAVENVSPVAIKVQGDNVQYSWAEYYEAACEKINRLYEKISKIPPPTLCQRGVKGDFLINKFKTPIQIRHEMSKKNYMDIVKRAKEYIKAGDIFQANLSQRVSADIHDVEKWEIYKILSRINPAPFAAYMDMADYQIVSSSPERLLRCSETMVETRPIAGTRPRGIDAKGDMEMRADLLLNEKERAEHLMLIDLERNDLGRICDYGSIVVDEFMITEDYSHVIHIVSNIKGRIAGSKDCFDAISAAFPGGTITGVPKVRCMEIIDELEPVARGPYTGSLGYIGFNGTMDLNIIIRTFVVKNGTAYVQIGAGIVADSDPEREYLETLKKAEALIRTLEGL